MYEFLGEQAKLVLAAHGRGDAAVVPHFGSWHPRLVGKSAGDIMEAQIDLTEVRETLAREFGFVDWTTVESNPSLRPDSAFEFAVDAVLTGDLEGLSRVIASDPSLPQQRSRFGHQATLLHYSAANGVETFRQQVPMNAVAVVGLLLRSGADPNSEARMYGGATPLGLFLTSAHPAQAGVTEDAARLLRAAGAQ